MQRIFRYVFLFLLLATMLAPSLKAQASGNAGTVTGTVTDTTGAIIPGATIEIQNPVSGYQRATQSDGAGAYEFTNIPYNNYHATATMQGFASQAADLLVHSSIPITQAWKLAPAQVTQSVTVSTDAGDLLENDSTFHTDIDRKLIAKLPLESASSSVSSLVTLSTPGIAADSNGLFHGLGDHAENSFSVDGQPITDQQSKVFSNQIPLDAIQSIQVIDGAPPAEYGDKTSVVIDVTTRSGLGVQPLTGSVTASYGSFGSANAGVNLAYGSDKWGDFISANGLNSGRFLDGPEFAVLHDKGNEENLFDRLDYQLTQHDSAHVNLEFTRSWFQTPNSYDSENLGGVNIAGVPVNGPADQRSQIKTLNIAPSLSHIINDSALVSGGLYVRRDAYNYYPSGDPFADLGPPNLQQETVAQQRTLTNAGAHGELTYSHGINNIKAGTSYFQTFLNENFQLGIVDPALLNTYGCIGTDGLPTGPPCTYLYPYDLTRGGTLYPFVGHTDVKELALYAEDAITKGNWAFNLGMRGDFYNGLTVARQAEPRLGLSYNVKRTNTVLRASYARTLETPFNENLILSSVGCANDVLNPLLLCSSSTLQSTPLSPGFRNEFHVGFQQAISRYVLVSGEYITKYTHNGYDFSVLGATPITFPIEWHNSKIPGYAGRINVPAIHGVSLTTVMSSVAARFFTPQVGGAGLTVGQTPGPFRIDHDERFNQTTHLQYQPKPNGAWMGFNWRFDSGLVAGAVPCYGTQPGNDCPQSTLLGGQPAIDLSGFTADEEFQAGFYCGLQKAGPFSPLPATCLASQFGSTLVKIPGPNTQNDDRNPPRIDSRDLFDLALGEDTLLPKLFHFKNEAEHFSGNITVVNVANKYALYNFLSTFSGTHYVTPRTATATLAFNF
jgi:hypothetical protein